MTVKPPKPYIPKPNIPTPTTGTNVPQPTIPNPTVSVPKDPPDIPEPKTGAHVPKPNIPAVIKPKDDTAQYCVTPHSLNPEQYKKQDLSNLPLPPVKDFSDLLSGAQRIAGDALSSVRCAATTPQLATTLKQLNAKLIVGGYGPRCSLSKDKGELETIEEIVAKLVDKTEAYYGEALPVDTNSLFDASAATQITEANATYELNNPNRNVDNQATPKPNSALARIKAANHNETIKEAIEDFYEDVPSPDIIPKPKAQPKKKPKQGKPTPIAIAKEPLEDEIDTRDKVYACGQLVPELRRKDETPDNLKTDTQQPEPITVVDTENDTQQSGPFSSLSKINFPSDFTISDMFIKPSSGGTTTAVGPIFFTKSKVPLEYTCVKCSVVGNVIGKTKDTENLQQIAIGSKNTTLTAETLEDEITSTEPISSTNVENNLIGDAPYLYGKLWVHGRVVKIEKPQNDICEGLNTLTLHFKLSANQLLAIAGIQSEGIIIDDVVLKGLTYTLENRPDGAYAIISGFPLSYLALDGKTSTLQFLVIQQQQSSSIKHIPEQIHNDPDIKIDKFAISSVLAEISAVIQGSSQSLLKIQVQDPIANEELKIISKIYPVISSSNPEIDLSSQIIDIEFTTTGHTILLHNNSTTQYLTLIDRHHRIIKIKPDFLLSSRIRNKSAVGRERLYISKKMPYLYDTTLSASDHPQSYLPHAQQTEIPAGILSIGANTAKEVLLFPTSYVFHGFEEITTTYHKDNLANSINTDVIYVNGSVSTGDDNAYTVSDKTTTIVEYDRTYMFTIYVLSNHLSAEINYKNVTDYPYSSHDYHVIAALINLRTPNQTHVLDDLDVYFSKIYSTILIMNKTSGIWVKRLRFFKEVLVDPKNTAKYNSYIDLEKVPNAPLPITNHTFDPDKNGKFVFYISTDKHVIRLDILTKDIKDLGIIDDTEDPIDTTHPIWSTNGGRSSQRPELWYKTTSGGISRIRPYETNPIASTPLTDLLADLLDAGSYPYEIIDQVFSPHITGFGVLKHEKSDLGKLFKHLDLLTSLRVIQAGGKLYLTHKNNPNHIEFLSQSQQSTTAFDLSPSSYRISVLDFKRRTRLIVENDDGQFSQNPHNTKTRQNLINTNLSVDDYYNLMPHIKPVNRTEIITDVATGLQKFPNWTTEIDLSTWTFKSAGLNHVS